MRNVNCRKLRKDFSFTLFVVFNHHSLRNVSRIQLDWRPLPFPAGPSFFHATVSLATIHEKSNPHALESLAFHKYCRTFPLETIQLLMLQLTLDTQNMQKIPCCCGGL